MALIERLILPSGTNPKIPIHAFMAAVAEAIRGKVSRATIVSTFGLRVEDETDLDFIISKSAALTTAERFEFGRVLHDVLLLAEGGFAYTTRTALQNRINEEPARPS